ncbi:MAG: hypothetical protein HQL03_00505 [Nitrospirae bacterium]|nr:hypothetical protein [Nitrospirota bacterium]
MAEAIELHKGLAKTFTSNVRIITTGAVGLHRELVQETRQPVPDGLTD